MRIPESPPENPFETVGIERFSELVSTFNPSPVDHKGRYLHWHELKRKPVPQGLDSALEYWVLTKTARKVILKPFPLSAIVSQQPFQYALIDSVVRKLLHIDKYTSGNIGSHVDGVANRKTGQQFLVKSLLMEEAISSSQLEGAATTRKVAKQMLTSGRKPTDKHERMIFNNYRLMQRVVELKDEPLSLDLICELHEIATHNAIENDALSGEFRQDNDIHISDSEGNLLYQPPDYQAIPKRMQAICDFANEDHYNHDVNYIPPVIKAIFLHFLIGFEHPFGDGNGRTARALFYWFMLKHGYWLMEFISISSLLKEAPIKYAKSYYYTESDELDVTYFIDYQTDILCRAIDHLMYYLNKKSDEVLEVEKLLSGTALEGRLNLRQMDILKKAAREAGYEFTITEHMQSKGVARNTARKDLQELAELGLLRHAKFKNQSVFIAPSNLKEVMQR